MELIFNCLECGHNILEEIMTDVIQTSVLSAIDDSGALDYNGVSSEGGEVSHYQCANCGKSLRDKESDCVVNDPKELAEWLKENCPQEDKNYIDDNVDKFENK